MNTQKLQNESSYYDDGILKVTFFTSFKGLPSAVAFRGKSKKPWFNYCYSNEEQREQRVKDHIASHLAALQQKDDWKTQKKESASKFKDALKPGIILSDSWGYDQTNVEFFEVVSVKGSKVTIQEIGHRQDGEPTSWASCYVVPDSSIKVGQPIEKIVRGNGIKIDSSVTLTLWDGSKCYKSWYA